MTAADEDPTAAAPMPPPKPGSTARAIALTVAVVLVFAGGWFAIWYNSDTQQATRACEAYIRDNVLKAPSTAKFSEEQFFDTDNPEVVGKVDAQNDYGAMIRSDFRCYMGKRGGDWVATDGFAG